MAHHYVPHPPYPQFIPEEHLHGGDNLDVNPISSNDFQAFQLLCGACVCV